MRLHTLIVIALTASVVSASQPAMADSAVQLTTGGGENPAWSPDSTRIAFASNRTTHWEIWSIPVGGGVATQISFIDGIDQQGGTYPAWSHDGEKIAFNKYNEATGSNDIWIVPSSGGAATPIATPGVGEWAPTWSPDDSEVAFHQSNGIFRMPSSGAGSKSLVFASPAAVFPSWSPSGTTIAYEILGDAVYRVPWNGGADEYITAGGRPAYTPNGNYLGFVEGGEVYAIAEDGGGVTQLTDAGGTMPAWDPAGTAVAFNRGGQIWILDVDEDDDGVGDYDTGFVTAAGDTRLSTGYVLHQNTPNPFNPVTAIRYDVPDAGGKVTLRIYDVAGRLVRTLVDRVETPGKKQVVWDGLNDSGGRAATGVYLCQMTAPGFTNTKKMALLK